MTKFAVLDASLGLSGDMFLAALLAAGAPRKPLDSICRDWLDTCLLAGPHPDDPDRAWTARLSHDRHHQAGHALTPPQLHERLAAAPVPESVRTLAFIMLEKLTAAEAQAHGVPCEQVHFHELGNLDTLLDLVGVPLLLQAAGLERVYCTPLELGCGTVATSHGTLTVPAPATRALLTGSTVVVTAGHVPGERTTPTGAVLAATLGDFSPAPAGHLLASGCGRGERPYQPVSRVTVQFFSAADRAGGLLQLATNLDDCDPRVLARAADLLLAAGARDVWTSPVIMKKGRAGQTLQVLGDATLRTALETIICRELPTFGVRAWPVDRHTITTAMVTVTTPWGRVRVRTGNGHATPEYEDCRALADAAHVPLHAIIDAARAAAGSSC